MSEELGRRTGTTELYEKSTRIEQTVREMKNLNANVDFYSASTYYALGIPIDLFTTIFAVSRMSGWTAHILEQYSEQSADPSARRLHGSSRRPALGPDRGSSAV